MLHITLNLAVKSEGGTLCQREAGLPGHVLDVCPLESSESAATWRGQDL